MATGANNHHFFLVDRHPFKCRVQQRPIDERRSQLARQHTLDHIPRGPGRQIQFHFRVALVIRRQHRGDAHGRRAFQRPQSKCALGVAARCRLAGLLDQVENTPRIVEKGPAGGRQTQAQFFANEQIHAQLLLQLLDTRCQVGGHAMQALGSGADAALLGHGLEKFELSEVHHSLLEKDSLLIIHY